VFPLHSSGVAFNGFEDLIENYIQLVPHVKMSGPTSFAPIVEAASELVRARARSFPVLQFAAW
jgi:E3 ubiquitin-protein ligase RGLG